MPAASEYGQIDFRKQVIMMIPPVVRSNSIVDWGHSLVKPLDSLMDADWAYIYDQYVIGHLTGQKMVMQGGLNFLFRITIAPFIIVETARDEGTTLYAYNEVEATDTFIYNEVEGTTIYLYNEAEAIQPAAADIIVKIPSIYSTPVENLDRLEQQVEILKPVGTTYKVVIY